MASSKHTPAETKVTTTVVKEAEITLTLSMEEAKSLLFVLNRVGGSPRVTRRGDTDEVRHELEKHITLPYGWHRDNQSLGRDRLVGSVEFATDDGLTSRG